MKSLPLINNNDSDFLYVLGVHVKDAIDLLQGHYIVSVSRDLTPPSQSGGLESIAVSTGLIF